DAFLRSLASDNGRRSVGILLSGSGSDGTLGLKAIKEGGGLTIAQTLATAKYDSMPRSAVAAGVVDDVLAPEEMPARVLEHARRMSRPPSVEERAAVVPVAPAEAGGVTDEQLEEALPRVAKILKRVTGHDFGHYKPGTLVRRLRRRLQQKQPSTLEEY